MPNCSGRPGGILRLLSIVSCLVLLAVLGLAPLGTAEDKVPAAPSYAGAETCLACHSDVGDLQQQDWHAKLLAAKPGSHNCEECHGPSLAHSEDPGTVPTATNVTKAAAAQSAAACLRCHESHIRPAAYKQGEHSRSNVQCWKCHSPSASPHAQTLRSPDRAVCLSCHREQTPTFEMTSHHPVREGRLECSDCHDPHGRSTPRDVNSLCASCHTKQRGPFIFEHGAISGGLTEGCLDCHQPHGSPNPDLLKYNGRGLCLQCHADKTLHFVGRTCWTSGCHSGHHGSNTSPLLLGN